jgi:hypothetical protein
MKLAPNFSNTGSATARYSGYCSGSWTETFTIQRKDDRQPPCDDVSKIAKQRRRQHQGNSAARKLVSRVENNIA